MLDCKFQVKRAFRQTRWVRAFRVTGGNDCPSRLTRGLANHGSGRPVPANAKTTRGPVSRSKSASRRRHEPSCDKSLQRIQISVISSYFDAHEFRVFVNLSIEIQGLISKPSLSGLACLKKSDAR